jgi:hypothetical protein
VYERSFRKRCIVFDREIRPRREEEHGSPSHPVAGPYSPFHVRALKANIFSLFDILSLQLTCVAFRSVGANANVVSGADLQARSYFLPGKGWFSNDGMLMKSRAQRILF